MLECIEEQAGAFTGHGYDLGVTLNSRTAIMGLTTQRKEAIRAGLSLFHLHISGRLGFHLMGLMAAIVQGVPLALLHMCSDVCSAWA